MNVKVFMHSVNWHCIRLHYFVLGHMVTETSALLLGAFSERYSLHCLHCLCVQLLFLSLLHIL